MALYVWLAIFAVVVGFAFMAIRMVSRTKEEEGLHDTGQAILDFGRSFPNEAIRQLQRTKSGQVLFVRLHDNKTGFMKNMRNHFACYLIEPGRARVRDAGAGSSIAVDFLDAPHHSGTYDFATPAEAAEVSLWLLGNYVASGDLVMPEITSANQA
jgi:hypothetical protein